MCYRTSKRTSQMFTASILIEIRDRHVKALFWLAKYFSTGDISIAI